MLLILSFCFFTTSLFFLLFEGVFVFVRVFLVLFSVFSSACFAIKEDKGIIYELGLESYYYDYNETANGQFFMEDKGVLYGLNLAVEAQLSQPWRFRGEFRYAHSGSVKYQSNGTGSMDNCDYDVTEYRLLAAYGLDERFDVYSGFTCRVLINDDSGKRSSSNALAYLRESVYLYLPIGVTYREPLSQDWALKASLEYDLFIIGEQFSGRPLNITNTQSSGWGARSSVEAKKYGTSFDFVVGAFVRYWDIDDSDIVRGGMEPENKTVEAGVTIGIAL